MSMISNTLRIGWSAAFRKVTAAANIGAPSVIYRGRHRTTDVAFQYRMGAGFAGDINRTHPFSAFARTPDATNPPTLYGIPVIITSTGTIRMITTGDSGLTDIDGISVRPYPIQGASAPSPYGAQGIGAVTPPTNQPMDYIESGHIMVPVVGSPSPRGVVYVWYAAPSGVHITGGFEAASSGSTFTIGGNLCYWGSQADASGIAELVFRP